MPLIDFVDYYEDLANAVEAQNTAYQEAIKKSMEGGGNHGR